MRVNRECRQNLWLPYLLWSVKDGCDFFSLFFRTIRWPNLVQAGVVSSLRPFFQESWLPPIFRYVFVLNFKVWAESFPAISSYKVQGKAQENAISTLESLIMKNSLDYLFLMYYTHVGWIGGASCENHQRMVHAIENSSLLVWAKSNSFWDKLGRLFSHISCPWHIRKKLDDLLKNSNKQGWHRFGPSVEIVILAATFETF